MLTLYERLPASELPFYLNLMAHLARAGVEVPAPIPDRTGALFSLLNGKPAGLVERVDGEPVDAPDPAHCAEVGAALARLHLASQTYRARLTNRRGPAWWRQAARAVKPHLSASQAALLDGEIKFQTGFGRGKLPKGAIHGDLFCDNVLFDGDARGRHHRLRFRRHRFLRVRPRHHGQRLVRRGERRRRSTRRSPIRSYRLTTRCARSTPTSARRGRRCCARRRCASGCRACTTCTCRVRASSRTRTTPRISSASCARGPPSRHGWPLPARCEPSMSDVPREFVFTRYPARQGIAGCAPAYAMFKRSIARAWVMLVLGYFIALLVLSSFPSSGLSRCRS